MRQAAEVGVRRFRVTGLLGRGGFGSVYRAVMEGPEGFSKDVAVKLIKNRNPPEEVLQRFRDEARILGLVRDRAVVSVDPPIVLGGRWAVVMEYVDGASLGQLVATHGKLPPGPAAAITAEVARALDKMWTMEGPDGKPLQLIHRDIKPANIQLTPAGEVKLLDFGIAKASFSARESETTLGIMGTTGFMAPERLTGDEGPTTDVFSLGMVLGILVTGKKPRAGASVLPGSTAQDVALLELAKRMVSIDPDERPSPREIERQCNRIAADCPPSLRVWAEECVPTTAFADADHLVGTVLSQTFRHEAAGSTTSRLLLGGGALLSSAVLGGGVVALVLGALVLGILIAGQLGGDPTPVAPEPTPTGPETIAQPAPDPIEDDPDVDPEDADPEDADPEDVDPEDADPEDVADPENGDPDEPETAPPPQPAPTVQPRPEPVVIPTPEPVAPEPPTGATYTVLFVSRPPDAAVYIDGVKRGITPVTLEIEAGSHTARMEREGSTHTQSIDVGHRLAKRHFWNISEDTWVPGF